MAPKGLTYLLFHHPTLLRQVATSQPYGSSAEVYSMGVILWQVRSKQVVRSKQ